MTLPRAVFADTSFYIALSSRKDATRPRAITWQRLLVADRCQIVTTEAVLWEWLNFSAASPVARALAVQGYQRIHADPFVEVVSFDGAACEAAVQLYASRSDKEWGVIDCLSFVAMKERGLSHALTADHHFEQAGFEALLLHDVPPSPQGT